MFQKIHRPKYFNLNFKLKMVCKQYEIPYCVRSLNAPCVYIKNWPEDGSLESKHVANYVLMIIYVCVCVLCLTE